MGKTLQDYILCNVSENEAYRFQKVLAKNPVTGASSDDIANLLEKFYGARDGDAWNKIFGPNSDPFDMTAEELERLTRIQRDPKFQVEFQLPLKGKGEKELKKMQAITNKFMLKNSVFFDSMKDVFLDIEDKTLNFSGRIELAMELLKDLGYNEYDSQKIVKDQYNQFNLKKAPEYFIPMADLSPEMKRPDLSLKVTAFIKKNRKKISDYFTLRTGQSSSKKFKDSGVGLRFEGPEYVLQQFLGPDGLNLPKEVFQRIMSNLYKFKV